MARITRREVMGAGAAAAGVALAGARSIAAPAVVARAGRPNVLFVPIDDLNDWVGWMGGYPGVKTPNLDRLARKACAFQRAYTPAPACQAARAAILFGIEPFRTGVYTNKTANWTETILRTRPSVVRWFREAGYRTFGSGKVFHGGWRGPGIESPEENDPKAWSEFEYFEQYGDGDGIRVEWGPTQQNERDTEDVFRAKWLAREVLSKRHDKPFFASVGIRKPHMPWFVPQRWFDQYPMKNVRYPLGALDTEHVTFATNRDDDDLPPAAKATVQQYVADHRKVLASGEWRSAIQGYLAAISHADHALGVMLDALQSGPNASDTIVCVWSDNGWQMGEKLAWRKFTLWERATRVPLLIGGNGLRSGETDALISAIDIYPTLARLALGEAPKSLDGVSFADYLAGGAQPRDHALSTWSLDVPGGGPQRGERHFAVRTKSHRLIQYGNGDRELYDNRVDPWEWRNLHDKPSKEHRALAEQMALNVPRSSVPRADPTREPAID